MLHVNKNMPYFSILKMQIPDKSLTQGIFTRIYLCCRFIAYFTQQITVKNEENVKKLDNTKKTKMKRNEMNKKPRWSSLE